MLQNIKSYYLIKFIYTFVEEVQKLRLVRYNKSIQKNLDISIINYKLFKGNYIIYESNRIGKEYIGNDDTLIYEGEYLNGKRNGKGKEYDKYNGKLKFEGEYLNNKEWIGAVYDENGNIKYKLNNGKNGNVKEYYSNGKLEFEGQYINGKRYGKGKEYWNDKLIFEGQYLNEQKNGKGKQYYWNNDKLEFEGEYLNDKKWNGKGYDSFGNILNELKDGKGLIKEYYGEDDRLLYEGEYLNGKRNGKGKEYYLNGYLKYEGEYLNDKWNGIGKEYWNDILIFEVEYLNAIN